MTAQSLPWEQHLIARAYEALEQTELRQPARLSSRSDLAHAYVYCSRLTRTHSRTFYVASALLPREQRLAARALYAFCRISDDLIDEEMADDDQIQRWRRHALSNAPTTDQPAAVAWTDARHRFRIPVRYAEQLLDGLAIDLQPVRYETFADLAHYCYGVASTVGLMAMHIVGFSDARAVPYAVRLGVALQLTNILRDVGEDWRRGRLYLPASELRAFNLTEESIAAGAVNQRWRAFMHFQIQRTRQLYAQALPGVGMLTQSGRLGIGAAAELYRAILDDIEAHDYDVFKRRAHTTMSEKLRRLPGIWWRARIRGYRKRPA